MAISLNSFSINKTNKGEYPKESLSDIVVSFSVTSDLTGEWSVEANLLFSTHGGGLGSSATTVSAGMVVVASKQADDTLTGPGTYSSTITIPNEQMTDVGTYMIRLRILPAPSSIGFLVQDSPVFFVVDVNQADIYNTLNDLQKENLDINQGEGGGTGDKTFSVSFTNQTSQVVVHNLNKYPNVVFKDTLGDEYEVDTVYDSLNQCTVSWNESMSGTIICN